MIVKATADQISEIKQMWKICFPDEDTRYVDFYFKNCFRPEDCFVMIREGKIISMAIRAPHAIMFNGRVLRTSMILGVATRPEHRHHGYMHDILNIIIDACEHTELVTLIRTETPALYEPYGFRYVYYRTQYRLERSDVHRVTNFGCAYEPGSLDLMKVYSAFIRRFNGFYPRTLEYFVNLKKEIKARNGKIVAYYNGKDQIQGYIVMVPQGDEIMAEEIVYLDSVALLKLCNAALQEKNIVNLFVSQAEDLSVAFPRAKKITFPSTMVRLNDPQLFSKVFHEEVRNVESAFAITKKPLNLNEWE